jgi:hypothetical protein
VLEVDVDFVDSAKVGVKGVSETEAIVAEAGVDVVEANVMGGVTMLIMVDISFRGGACRLRRSTWC